MDDQVAAGAERPGAKLTNVVSGVTVQLHMLLQVFLKVEGLPTGWLWAGEGLLVDVLVFLVVIQILPVREDPSTAREVTGQQLSFGSFPNSLGANLSSVLIPCRGQSRLSLTPRAMGSKEGAEGLEGGPCPRMPLPSVSAIRLPGQGLSLLVCFRGPPELWLYPDFYRPRSSRTQ